MNRSANTSNKTKQAVIVSTSIYKDLLIYPNPTKDGSFNLEFSIEEDSAVSLEIFNFTGQIIYSRLNQHFNKGNHTMKFAKDNVNLAPGFYVVKMVTNEFVKSRKFLVE
jgi:hypothetical protein